MSSDASWLGQAGLLFNPKPKLGIVALPTGHPVIVVDDVLAEPERVAAWAARQRLQPPGYPYPGLVSTAPDAMNARFADFFAQHARSRLGGRRTVSSTVRLSLVTTPPEELSPNQWQCHRDSLIPDTNLFAASVLYLFHDPALGGTDFYVPRIPPREVDQLLEDGARMGADEFAARHGVARGYMTDSNHYFERIAQLPARWNRMILYDGAVFHSGAIGRPHDLSVDPARGRLTLNGFFVCSRLAR